MTILNRSLIGALVAVLLVSCGGANPIAKPTDDPLAGTFVTKGGGGALDAVKALTSGFSAVHPTVLWQGFDDVGSDAGVDFTQFHFLNNLWDKPYTGDTQARTGDPLFVDPGAHTPEGYRLRSGSAARACCGSTPSSGSSQPSRSIPARSMPPSPNSMPDTSPAKRRLTRKRGRSLCTRVPR